jgi:hypothetical protein
VIAAGCDYIQFDEPMWTESPEDSVWSAEILNELIASLPPVRVALHVCGGNPRRKRIYFTKYTDLVPAFRTVKIDEVVLEHCTLSYDLMDLWKLWDFKGDLALGVIDQRSDSIETPRIVRDRISPRSNISLRIAFCSPANAASATFRSISPARNSGSSPKPAASWRSSVPPLASQRSETIYPTSAQALFCELASTASSTRNWRMPSSNVGYSTVALRSATVR